MCVCVCPAAPPCTGLPAARRPALPWLQAEVTGLFSGPMHLPEGRQGSPRSWCASSHPLVRLPRVPFRETCLWPWELGVGAGLLSLEVPCALPQQSRSLGAKALGREEPCELGTGLRWQGRQQAGGWTEWLWGTLSILELVSLWGEEGANPCVLGRGSCTPTAPFQQDRTAWPEGTCHQGLGFMGEGDPQAQGTGESPTFSLGTRIDWGLE